MPQDARTAMQVSRSDPDGSWSYIARSYDTCVEQEQGLDGFEQQYRQIGKGAYEGRIESLRMGEVCLSREYANLAMEHEFRFSDNTICLGFPTAAAGQGTGSFGKVAPGHAIVPPAGRDNRFYPGAIMDLIILTLPIDPEFHEFCRGVQLSGAGFTGWLCTVLDVIRTGYDRAPLMRLLPELIRDHLSLLQPADTTPTAPTRKDRAIFAEISDACTKMMPEDMTVIGLAAQLRRPRADLRRASLAMSGQRLDDLLMARRMNNVYRALRDTPGRRTIGEIALDHGFTHAGRFSLAFREMFGKRPRDIRPTLGDPD